MFPDLVRRCADITVEQAQRLQAHYELLCRWNRVINLTRIDRLEEAVERHYCESLFLATHLPETGSVVDVGSGGGFPGLVVAIARPGCSITLVESHQRKAAFLKEAARGLPNVRVCAVRGEEILEDFEWLISRAVSYADLTAVIRLAPRIALLTGGEEPPRSWVLVWEVIRLPWGKQRVLRLGGGSAGSVSRETNR